MRILVLRAAISKEKFQIAIAFTDVSCGNSTCNESLISGGYFGWAISA
jgi:hypothetical protein